MIDKFKKTYLCFICRFKCHKDCVHREAPSCGLSEEMVNLANKTYFEGKYFIDFYNWLHASCEKCLANNSRIKEGSFFHPDHILHSVSFLRLEVWYWNPFNKEWKIENSDTYLKAKKCSNFLSEVRAHICLIIL
jgi:hypothetical protein